MKIEDVFAMVLKIPRSGCEFAGTAGLEGTLVQTPQGIHTDYHLVAPYWTLYSSHIETLLVKITTDNGIIGYGEAQAPVGPEVTKTIVEKLLKPNLAGRNPLDVAVLWDRMYSSMKGRGHTTGFMLDAISAVDIALWDIIGKFLSLPVYQLLGGAFRDKIECYASGLPGPSVEEMVKNANDFKQQGFKAIKLFCGKHPAGDIEMVKALREAVGDEIKLMVDVQWMYDVPTAIKVGKEFEQYDVYWLETPIAPEDIDGNAEIARSLDLAVALGECERTCYQFKELLQRRAADIIQPDVGRAGGITGVKKIAALAESYNVPCALHCGVGLGVYIAAALQLAAAIPNFLIIEYQRTMHQVANELLFSSIVCDDGFISVPQKPGIGVQINEEAAAAYAEKTKEN